MAKTSIERQAEAQLVAAPTVPPVAASKDGHLKVRFAFLTHQPKHIRNLMLRSSYGIKPPYNEDVCILFPAHRAFNDVESYENTFDFLKKCGVLHHEDTLIEVRILVEDETTLAYVIE